MVTFDQFPESAQKAFNATIQDNKKKQIKADNKTEHGRRARMEIEKNKQTYKEEGELW